MLLEQGILTQDELPGAEAVLSAAAAFLGESVQIPPMYSAIKINGQKLVDLALEGKR